MIQLPESRFRVPDDDGGTAGGHWQVNATADLLDQLIAEWNASYERVMIGPYSAPPRALSFDESARTLVRQAERLSERIDVLRAALNDDVRLSWELAESPSDLRPLRVAVHKVRVALGELLDWEHQMRMLKLDESFSDIHEEYLGAAHHVVCAVRRLVSDWRENAELSAAARLQRPLFVLDAPESMQAAVYRIRDRVQERTVVGFISWLLTLGGAFLVFWLITHWPG